MDTGQNSMNIKGKGGGKGGEKARGSNPRAKATNWPPAISEFVLDWFIEKKLLMPPKTVFKKMHHTACTTAVNSKYGTAYTVEQVHRHWRRHKDTWGLVAKHMNESGGGFDYDTKMVTVSQSTLNELSANDRGILTKPIQFFDKLQELFSGCTADGSFMQDASTAADPDQDDTEIFDMMNDMANYDNTDDAHGHDSDKLQSDSDDCQEVAALGPASSQVSSSSVKSMKPNKRNFKRSGKNTVPVVPRAGRVSKSNAKLSPACADDDMDVEITNTLRDIQQNLAKPVQVAPPPDPNAPLWDMLKKIALPPDDRLAVGMHLCKPEFKVHRSFLISMGQDYLERWVLNYLSGGDLGGDDLGGDDPGGSLGV